MIRSNLKQEGPPESQLEWPFSYRVIRLFRVAGLAHLCRRDCRGEWLAFFHRIVSRNFEQRLCRFRATNVRQPVGGFPGTWITVPSHNYHLQLRRVPPFTDDLDRTFIANLTSRNSQR